jgi:phage shock protein E
MKMIELIKKYLFGRQDEIKSALAEGAIVIDVRTPGEFNHGHLKGARNIPLNELSSKLGLISKWEKKIILVCRSGQRSLMARKILKQSGIEAINGGAWNNLLKFEHYKGDYFE